MKMTGYRRYWIILAVAVTGLCGLAYLLAQQSVRQSANDPQIQMAEDTAAALENGKSPADFNAVEKIDIAQSLSPFLVVYDMAFHPIAFTGELNGSAPTLPDGVLQSASDNGGSRVTWQPREGVRSALVIVPYSEGYVVAGRSLRESEARADDFLKLSGIAWLIILVATLCVAAILRHCERSEAI